ncbi:MAG: alkaline phosphatase family protein, partial [Acidobacteria bacterium]|nr:alkaline phosphatase family protein [Acidobacteriota bacterium]
MRLSISFAFTACLTALIAAPLRAAESPQVVILGFDGADPKLVEQYMAEGKLPNLSRLKEEGDYHRLATTNPPQTPVSWSTFSTGINPGRTEIFDFLKRSDGTYIPEFAMASEGKKPFIFGDRTGWLVGGGIFLTVLLLGGGAAALASSVRRKIVLASMLLAAAGG